MSLEAGESKFVLSAPRDTVLFHKSEREISSVIYHFFPPLFFFLTCDTKFCNFLDVDYQSYRDHDAFLFEECEEYENVLGIRAVRNLREYRPLDDDGLRQNKNL